MGLVLPSRPYVQAQVAHTLNMGEPATKGIVGILSGHTEKAALTASLLTDTRLCSKAQVLYMAAG